ncbi:MAG: intracellular septation protein [Candidatus Tokpelaia sp. JSC189]|nr:MAG: intracellular septation protein [Candidatus Tokpelaia sp. JSC189]
MSQSIFESDPQDIKTTEKTHMSPILNFSLEIGPLLIFLFVNFRGEWLINNIPLFSSFDKAIYPATVIFMTAIVIALIISWWISHKIPVIPMVSGIFVLILGFLTLWLHDDIFIKMKPTFINTFFCLILFGGLFFKKSLLRYVMDSTIKLDSEGWRKLTFRWAFFFLFLAVLNEIIWRNFSNEIWSTFKVFGIMPVTIIFMLMQTPLLIRHTVELIENKE